MKTSSNTLFVVAAIAAVIVLSVVLFNSKQAPQKAAITKAEVKLPTEAMTKEWLARADESQAKAKEQWEHLAKLKEQSNLLAGDKVKNNAERLAEVKAELEKAAERLKQKKLNPKSVEFNAPDQSKRIPPGATDPDKLWRTQMQNARATLREAGIPTTR